MRREEIPDGARLFDEFKKSDTNTMTFRIERTEGAKEREPDRTFSVEAFEGTMDRIRLFVGAVTTRWWEQSGQPVTELEVDVTIRGKVG